MAKEYDIINEEPQMASEPVAAYNVSPTPVFSPYQMQILDSISKVRSEKELKDIRDIIAEYFSNKALDAMDKLCDEGKLSVKELESWSSGHDRTPYAH